MIRHSPLGSDVVFRLGPLAVTQPVITTWVIIALLAILARVILRRPALHAGAAQTVLEILVQAAAAQIRDVMRCDPWPYLPLLASLFIFLLFANLSTVVPGVSPPTAHIETPAALGGIVFLSVHYFGIRAQGLRHYLRRYIRPNPFLLPLNLLSEITRIFSLMVRLFGNIMSHELVIAVIVLLVGLLVPVPFMLLSILIGIIQAYIFTILAAVFIGAAIGSVEEG